MAVQGVTVNLPDPLYQRLARRANRTLRTVETAIVDIMNTSFPDEPDELPRDMAEAIAALYLLGDDDLWRAARQTLDAEKPAVLEALHIKRQRAGLSGRLTQPYLREYHRDRLFMSNPETPSSTSHRAAPQIVRVAVVQLAYRLATFNIRENRV